MKCENCGYKDIITPCEKCGADMLWTKEDCDRAGCSLIFSDLEMVKDDTELRMKVWRCKGCGAHWRYDGYWWKRKEEGVDKK